MFKRNIILLAILAIFTAGCNKTMNEVLESLGSRNNTEDESYNDGWEAVKLAKETRYYNDFLGFSYAVPRGWWLYSVNEENLSESRGGIEGDIAMDIYFHTFLGYSYSSAWLLAFGNLETSDQDNHLGFDIDARFLENVNGMGGFMEYFEAYMLEPDEGVEYRLTGSRQIPIKGVPFEVRDYLVTQDDYRDYNIITFSCPTKAGYFLNIKVDYWPENTRAKDAIIDSVTRAIEFY